MGELLQKHFNLGIMTSPRLTGTEITEWHKQFEMGSVVDIIPQLKGKAVIQLFGTMPDFGEFYDLDPTTVWDKGVRLTEIHQDFGIKSYGDFYLVVFKADFTYFALPD